MTYRGHVKGGVVVLDEAVSLPEGVEVDVAVRAEPTDDLLQDQAALVARGRALVRRAQERNHGVADEVIEHDVARAIDEVRGRGRA